MTIAIAVKLGEYRGIITDTALVCETKDGEDIRVGETENKVFLKDDCAIFCSGNMGVCNHIRRHILEMTDFCIENLVSYLKYLNNEDTISNDDMAIIIVDKNKITGIKANNNFEPIYFDGEGKIVHTGIFMVNGKRISSEEENALINNKMVSYLSETKNITKALVKTAKDFLNTLVGGKLKVFTYNDKLNKFELSYSEIVDNLLEESRERAKQISHNQLHMCKRHKVWEEKEDIEYSSLDGTVNASIINSSTLNGGSIIGSSINIGNGSFTVDNGGNAFMSSVNIANKIIADINGTKIYGADIQWISSDPKIATAQSTANSALINAQNALSSANSANNYTDEVNSELKKIKSNIGYTKIGEDYVISPNIIGGEISGGAITSKTVINVGTEATIGKKLIINADDFLGGIEFRYNYGMGEKIAEIYVDPAGKSLNIEADGGICIKSSNNEKVYLNNVEFTGTQPKVTGTFG